MLSLLVTAIPAASYLGTVTRISESTFGIIVDGIDEGRSKTSEKAFEAFLDDLTRRCKGAPGA